MIKYWLTFGDAPSEGVPNISRGTAADGVVINHLA